jgi:hypothetical protein
MALDIGLAILHEGYFAPAYGQAQTMKRDLG